MKLTGTPEQIIADAHDAACVLIPGERANVPAVLDKLRPKDYKPTREIAEYQAAVLYALASKYNKRGARLLEIGTARGYSCSVLAEAAPNAKEIITLNPDAEECTLARQRLDTFDNVKVLTITSWDFNQGRNDALDAKGKQVEYDLIFVDGDHKRIRLDLPYFDRLKIGGLILFHDYSPKGTYRECPPVYTALNEFQLMLERDFDVCIIDDGGVGMVGFYRREGESLMKAHKDWLEFIGTAQLYSIHTPERLRALYDLGRSLRNVEGCIVDAGSQNGGASGVLMRAMHEPRAVWRDVHCFDTFAGQPKPTEEDGGKAAMKYEHRGATWGMASERNIAELLQTKLKVPGKNVHIHTGLVQEISDKEIEAVGDIAVLHCDLDFYKGTDAALRKFYPQVVSGGVVIVAAYGHWPGSAFAVNNFLAGLPEPVEFKTLEGPCVWWTKL